MEAWLFRNIRSKHSYVIIRCSSNSWKHVKSGKVDVPLNRFPLKLSGGKLARFTDGACTAEMGNTSVMVTAVSKAKSSSFSFMPLTVDYRQKAAAAGRIPTNYFRRELGPTEKEVLTSRLIDRSLRPLFPKGFCCETQLSCNLLAVDGVHDPDVVSINAASAALAVSDIPWDGPVGAVRVGLIDKKVVLNPTRKELSGNSLNLVVAAADHNRVVMLEGAADNLDPEDVMKAIEAGVKETQTIIDGIRELRKQIGKEKRVVEKPVILSEISEYAKLMCEARVTAIFTDASYDKIGRDKALEEVRQEVTEKLKENFEETELNILSDAVNDVIKQTFRNLVLETNKRCDGRGLTELRDISCSVNVFSPLHGSALFQRGQTQVFCTVAFDSVDSAFRSDIMSVITGGMKEKNFMLHYEFPPYATNEIGRFGSFGRREVGHGALAEKSLRPVVPPNFPFTIRLTSEVLESNGSSSMATVCGGCLALMDAGVPISSAVAGVAIGLISVSDPEKPYDFSDYRLLTDILGIEDYLGDMDFKLAGSEKGITGLQLDVKVPGLPQHVVMEAMKQASDAKQKVLSIMEQAIAKPREEKKKNWPLSENLVIPVHKRTKFFGSGGYNIKKITAETGVQLTRVDEGTFSIFAPNQDAMDEAKEIIESLLADENVPELQYDSVYPADIVELRDSGVMIKLYPSMKPVFVRNSQLDQRKVSHPSALGLEVGQKIQVKYFGRDTVSGEMRFSRKVLQIQLSKNIPGITSETRTSIVMPDRKEEPSPVNK